MLPLHLITSQKFHIIRTIILTYALKTMLPNLKDFNYEKQTSTKHFFHGVTEFYPWQNPDI